MASLRVGTTRRLLVLAVACLVVCAACESDVPAAAQPAELPPEGYQISFLGGFPNIFKRAKHAIAHDGHKVKNVLTGAGHKLSNALKRRGLKKSDTQKVKPSTQDKAKGNGSETWSITHHKVPPFDEQKMWASKLGLSFAKLSIALDTLFSTIKVAKQGQFVSMMHSLMRIVQIAATYLTKYLAASPKYSTSKHLQFLGHFVYLHIIATNDAGDYLFKHASEATPEPKAGLFAPAWKRPPRRALLDVLGNLSELLDIRYKMSDVGGSLMGKINSFSSKLKSASFSPVDILTFKKPSSKFEHAASSLQKALAKLRNITGENSPKKDPVPAPVDPSILEVSTSGGGDPAANATTGGGDGGDDPAGGSNDSKAATNTTGGGGFKPVDSKPVASKSSSGSSKTAAIVVSLIVALALLGAAGVGFWWYRTKYMKDKRRGFHADDEQDVELLAYGSE